MFSLALSELTLFWVASGAPALLRHAGPPLEILMQALKRTEVCLNRIQHAPPSASFKNTSSCFCEAKLGTLRMSPQTRDLLQLVAFGCSFKPSSWEHHQTERDGDQPCQDLITGSPQCGTNAQAMVGNLVVNLSNKKHSSLPSSDFGPL